MQLLDQIQELSGTRSPAVPQPPSPAPVSVPAAPVKLAELQPSSPAVSSPQSSFSVPAEPSSLTNWMPLPETCISTVSSLQTPSPVSVLPAFSFSPSPLPCLPPCPTRARRPLARYSPPCPSLPIFKKRSGARCQAAGLVDLFDQGSHYTNDYNDISKYSNVAFRDFKRFTVFCYFVSSYNCVLYFCVQII